MIWINVVIVLMMGGLLCLVPNMSRSTVPLGVSVPSDRTEEPVVRTAIRRFRLAVIVISVLVAVGVAVIGVSDRAGAVAPLVVVVVGGCAFVWARRPIAQTKRAQGWYEGVPVRLRASVTGQEASKSWARRVEFEWYAASLLMVLATAAVGVARYSDLPERIPTHFTGGGTPDQYSDTSVLAVFGPLLICIGVMAVFLAILAVPTSSVTRQYPDGDPAASIKRAHRVRSLMVRLLGALSVVITAMICGACLAIYFDATSWALMPVMIGGLVLVGLVVIWSIAASIRIQKLSTAIGPSASGGTADRPSESADDDRFWKAGLFYDNPDDPSFFVPKRQGIGVTVNFGHAGGKIAGAVLLLIVAGSIVTSVVGG